MKVLFVCSASVSSNVFVTRCNDEAQANKIDLEMNCCDINSLAEVMPKYRMVILSPQTQYALAKLSSQYPDIKILPLPTSYYAEFDFLKFWQFLKDNSQSI